MVALGWLILELTDNPFYIGLLGLTRAVPLVGLSPIGGAVADRFNRRHVLFFAQLGLALPAVGFWLLTVAGVVQIWHILALSFVSACALAFDQPTRHALLPSLVPREDLLAAFSLNAIAFNGSAVFGPSLAGLVAAWLGLPGCFLVNALSFSAIFMALAQMEFPAGAPRPAGGPRPTMWQDMAEGLVYVRQHPLVLALVGMAASASLLARPFQHFLPVLARDVLHLEFTGLGLLATGPGLGTIVFSLLQAGRGDRGDKGRRLLMAGLALAGALVVVAWSRWVPLTYLGLVAAGGLGTTFMTNCNTLLQQQIDDNVRGRVISLWTMTGLAMMQIGQLPMGAMMNWVGPSLALTLGGAAAALAFLTITGGVPRLVRLR